MTRQRVQDADPAIIDGRVHRYSPFSWSVVPVGTLPCHPTVVCVQDHWRDANRDQSRASRCILVTVDPSALTPK